MPRTNKEMNKAEKVVAFVSGSVREGPTNRMNKMTFEHSFERMDKWGKSAPRRRRSGCLDLKIAACCASVWLEGTDQGGG